MATAVQRGLVSDACMMSVRASGFHRGRTMCDLNVEGGSLGSDATSCTDGPLRLCLHILEMRQPFTSGVRSSGVTLTLLQSWRGVCLMHALRHRQCRHRRVYLAHHRLQKTQTHTHTFLTFSPQAPKATAFIQLIPDPLSPSRIPRPES